VGSDPSDAPRSDGLTRIAQVVPDLPTFSVDDGFSYRVPDTLSDVVVGSLVRVPLGNRKVRGVVTHVRDATATVPLKDILSVVGDLPVVTARLLETMRWASIHYVAPLAAVLAKAAPPNIARSSRAKPQDVAPLVSPLPETTAAAASGRHLRPQYLVIPAEQSAEAVAGLIGPVVEAGRNGAVILPTVAEAHRLARGLVEVAGVEPWIATSSESAASVTAAWSALESQPGQLVVGTREIAFWPLGAVGMVVVVEEGRPAMTAPQTPTTSVRDVMRRRAAAERFGLVFLGPVPTVETLSAGVDVHEPPGRVWPLIEVVDRTTEPPGTGVFTQAAIQAIAGVVRSRGRVFVFVTRRGDAAAFRCVGCGTLRRCRECDAAITRGDECHRCGTRPGACNECGESRFQALGAGVGRAVSELRRSFGDAVGRVGDESAVLVGTERDLPEIGDMALSVVVDGDGIVLAPHYRAEEDALRLLARVALRVKRGRGHRCLIQTTQPGHRVYGALRHGRPLDLLRRLAEEREAQGFPPVAQLVALEITNPVDGTDAAVRSLADEAVVHGPAPMEDGLRWLVSGRDLRSFKIVLRGEVQRWRDAGAKVRIDADPVRL
jgi:primosomal protein N'